MRRLDLPAMGCEAAPASDLRLCSRGRTAAHRGQARSYRVSDYEVCVALILNILARISR